MTGPLESLREVDMRAAPNGMIVRLSWWQLVSLQLMLAGAIAAVWTRTSDLGTKVDRLSEVIIDLRTGITDDRAKRDSLDERLIKVERMTANGVPPTWLMKQVEALEKRVDTLERGSDK